MGHAHALLLTYPAQGSVNPLLQLAKNLVRLGVEVTLLVSLSVQRRMTKTSPIPEGLTLVAFSDGYDDGVKPGDDQHHFRSEFKRHGSDALSELITASAKKGHPVTSLVYAMGLPWAAEVARAFSIPSTVLWIQPASVFDVYFHYFNGYADEIMSLGDDPSSSVQLPSLPDLTGRELPFSLKPGSFGFQVQLPATKEQLDTLDEEPNPKILVNTFDALEPEALTAIEKYKLIAIGPLVPSAFLDGKDPTDTEFGGDLYQKSKDYIKWLDSKPKSSIVYVSFGSFFMLPKQQTEEIARGLLESKRPFLWVMRLTQEGKRQEDELSCREELQKQGMIVPWCSQVEVLSHPSVGCFVTHCGWNSSLESLVSGIPVVGLPQAVDQPTNAKLLQDKFKTGVRASANEEGIVGGNEIKRCIELVMGDGENGEEMRRNAKKWKVLAKEAAKEGGSSDLNLKAFVQEIGGGF